MVLLFSYRTGLFVCLNTGCLWLRQALPPCLPAAEAMSWPPCSLNIIIVIIFALQPQVLKVLFEGKPSFPKCSLASDRCSALSFLSPSTSCLVVISFRFSQYHTLNSLLLYPALWCHLYYKRSSHLPMCLAFDFILLLCSSFGFL